MQEDPEQGLRPLLVLAVLSVLIGGAIDLALDRPKDWLTFHAIFETLMVAGAMVMAVTLWLGWRNAAQRASELMHRLDERSAERDAWRQRARRSLEGLGEAVDDQFREWGLTPAEREVALLLLKGYSHKRVAKATDRSERTARQHAVAVYQKAGLSGRAELAAFFLEDLVLPEAEPE